VRFPDGRNFYRVGIDASFARLIINDENIEEAVSELPDNYRATYQPNFDYNGTESPAIISETMTLNNFSPGAIIAPKRLVLVKGFGVVEWDDFNGNTWVLEEWSSLGRSRRDIAQRYALNKSI